MIVADQITAVRIAHTGCAFLTAFLALVGCAGIVTTHPTAAWGSFRHTPARVKSERCTTKSMCGEFTTSARVSFYGYCFAVDCNPGPIVNISQTVLTAEVVVNHTTNTSHEKLKVINVTVPNCIDAHVCRPWTEETKPQFVWSSSNLANKGDPKALPENVFMTIGRPPGTFCPVGCLEGDAEISSAGCSWAPLLPEPWAREEWQLMHGFYNGYLSAGTRAQARIACGADAIKHSFRTVLAFGTLAVLAVVAASCHALHLTVRPAVAGPTPRQTRLGGAVAGALAGVFLTAGWGLWLTYMSPDPFPLMLPGLRREMVHFGHGPGFGATVVAWLSVLLLSAATLAMPEAACLKPTGGLEVGSRVAALAEPLDPGSGPYGSSDDPGYVHPVSDAEPRADVDDI